MKFIDKLIQSLEKSDSNVCVGLDSRYDRIPKEVAQGLSVSEAIFAFNKEVVDATHDLACAYKSNLAFYAGFGAQGMKGLELSNEYIRSTYPHIPLFADCKRSEMGESVKMVKNEIFSWLHFDCVMVTPWFGSDTLKDYLDDEEHGVLVYVHDSNPSAVEVQDLELKDGRRVYEAVTELSATTWNTNGNVIIEAGATYLDQLRRVRQIVGEEMPILTAGVGAQGATAQSLSGLFGRNGQRLFVNSSRGIIFAGESQPDYFAAVRDAAKTLRDELHLARK